MPARKLPHFASIDPEATAQEAAARMAEGNYSCLVVAEQGRVIGMLTDGDLVARVVSENSEGDDRTVREVMTSPPRSVRRDESYATLVEKMSAWRVRQLPIVDDGRLCGMVAVDDLIEILAGELEDLAMAVRHEIWLTRFGEPDPLRDPNKIESQLGWRPRDRERPRPR